MKLLLKAIFRAIRKAMRAAARAARGVGGAVADFVDGFFSGPYVEEVDYEGFDPVAEQVANDNQATAQTLARPSSDLSLAERIKAAGARRDAGRPLHDLFEENDPVHRKARAWVASLDEGGLRALRHMPIQTLGRHLDPRDSVRGAGLPIFDPTLPEVVAAKEKAGREPLTDRAMDRARSRGRKITLDDVTATVRRA